MTAKKKENPLLARVKKQKEGVSNLFRPIYMEIAIERLVALPQIRKEFENDDNRIDDLAQDIKVRGIKQNLVVTPLHEPDDDNEERFLIISGERRCRGAKRAGLLTVPCKIEYDINIEDIKLDQLLENVQRKDLTLAEEAAGLQDTLDALNGDTAELLKKLNKSKSWLSKRLALLRLPEQTDRLSKEFEDLNLIHKVKKFEAEHPQNVVKQLVDELIENKAEKGKQKQRDGNDETVIVDNDRKKKNKGLSAREIVDKYKKKTANNAVAPDELLERVYSDIRAKVPVDLALGQFDDNEIKIINDALSEYFKLAAGDNKDRVSYCIKAFRDGVFSAKDYRVLFFAAFMFGFDGKELSLSDILEDINGEVR